MAMGRRLSMEIPRSLAEDVLFLGIPVSQFIGLGMVHGALFCVGFMGSLILGMKALIFVPFGSFMGCVVVLRRIQKHKKRTYLADWCRYHVLSKGIWKA